MISGSIDDIVNHFASCRFGSDSTVAMTFQNETVINSTLYFCRAAPDEFNFSSNPTYTDANGQINVIQAGQVNQQKPFSFVTTVGLYNAQEALLAVAKLSRPVEKNEEKDLRDTSGCAGNTTETENCGDNCQNEECKCPTKHD